jgi:hypothetical protein
MLKANTLIEQWMAFDISNEAEVCAASGPWVFVQRRSLLFKTYPVFDRPEVRERLDQIVPTSDTSPGLPETKSRRRQSAVHSLLLSGSPSSRPMPQPPASGAAKWLFTALLALASAGLGFLVWYLIDGLEVMMWMVY